MDEQYVIVSDIFHETKEKTSKKIINQHTYSRLIDWLNGGRKELEGKTLHAPHRQTHRAIVTVLESVWRMKWSWKKAADGFGPFGGEKVAISHKSSEDPRKNTQEPIHPTKNSEKIPEATEFNEKWSWTNFTVVFVFLSKILYLLWHPGDSLRQRVIVFGFPPRFFGEKSRGDFSRSRKDEVMSVLWLKMSTARNLLGRGLQ